jgi:hypothetical protein
MMPSSVVERSIRRSIEWGDHVRGSSFSLNDMVGHKEWLHFCISSEGLDLLINFSLADDTRAAAPAEARLARLVCIVRTDRWEGDIDQFDQDEVRVERGRVYLRFGESFIRYRNGAFHVVARLRARPVAIKLVFTPVALPSMVNDIQLTDGPPSHWFLVPRLLATGRISVAGRDIEIEDVPAYHDHNWGYFRWGHDFAWAWGYGHGGYADRHWTLTFDQLTNRARTTDFVRGIVLWRGARQQRLFGSRDIALREEGLLRPQNTLKLPRVLALLAQGDATDVPATLFATARAQDDALDFEFNARSLCQILVPNDDDLGLTIINEVSGELVFDGSIHGEHIEGRGRAMFEFLRA